MSEKIKDLFKTGQFEVLLDSTNGTTDPEDLLYRVLALEATYRYKEALEEYNKNDKLVENWDLIGSCKAKMFLLVYFKMDKEIPDEIEHYRAQPYVNQETEEFMNDLENYVAKLREYFSNPKDTTDVNLKEIKDLLFNGDKEEQLIGIKKMFDLEAQGVSCKNIVVEYLKSHIEFNTNYALLLDYAIYSKCDEHLVFKKNHKYYCLVPRDFLTYVDIISKALNEHIKYLNVTEKNISIIHYISLISRPTFIYLLPDEIEVSDLDSMMAALVIEASKIYDVDITNDEYLKGLKVKPEMVSRFQEIINIVQNEF